MQGLNYSTCAECEKEEENFYDEVSREVGSNLISIKVPRGKKREVQAIGSNGVITNQPPITAICRDEYGQRCNSNCTRVNISESEKTPAGGRGMLLLKCNREIIDKSGQNNSLEIELITPKNYVPLSDPRKYPRPPIIIPRTIEDGKSRRGGDGRGSRRKRSGSLPLAYCSENPRCRKKCDCLMK